MPFHVIEHPLIKHKLSMIRDKTCSTKMFREIVTEISMLMVYEISRNLKLEPYHVETPIEKTIGYQLSQDVVLVPILRAGLGMVEGIQSLIPSAKVAHIGMFRDPETWLPSVYYAKFPSSVHEAKVFILDPLLATGGSILKAIQYLHDLNVKDITVISLIGVKQGIDHILSQFPNVHIYLASQDEKLNDHAYIVPGLGDAGDRLFGTK